MMISNSPIVSAVGQKDGQTKTGPASGFSDALFNAVNEVNNLQQTADKEILNVQAGNTVVSMKR